MAAIADETQSWMPLFGLGPVKTFVGGTSQSGFRLRRAIIYANGGQALGIGVVSATDTGSRLEVRLRLTTPAILFLCVWYGALSVMALLTLFSPQSRSNVWAWAALFGMAGFVWLFMVLGGFWFDARGFRRDLSAVISEAERRSGCDGHSAG